MVKNSIVFSGTVIGEGSVIENSIVDENVSVGKACRIGECKDKTKKIAVLGRDISVSDHSVIPDGAMVDCDVKGGEQ